MSYISIQRVMANLGLFPLDKKTHVGKILLSLYLAFCVCAPSIYYLVNYGKSSYSYAEYFANYRGGFVRRGISGQILLFIPKQFDAYIFPILAGLSLLAIISSILILLSICKISNLNTSIKWILLLHPALFTFYTLIPGVLLKKEIFLNLIFLIIIRRLILQKKKINNLGIQTTFLTLLSISPFLILFQEVWIFYLFSLTLALVSDGLLNLPWFLKSHLGRICSLLLFLNLFLYIKMMTLRVEMSTVDKQLKAVSRFDITPDPFFYSSNPYRTMHTEVMYKFTNTNTTMIYTFCLLSSILIIWKLFPEIRNKAQKSLMLACPTLVLFLIASDWSRWISIISFIFLGLLLLQRQSQFPNLKPSTKDKALIPIKVFMLISVAIFQLPSTNEPEWYEILKLKSFINFFA